MNQEPLSQLKQDLLYPIKDLEEILLIFYTIANQS